MNTAALLDAVVSHAQALGLFERVNGHEPKNAPGNGLSYAVWVDRIQPLGSVSGLSETSGVIVLNGRVYTSMTTEPQDFIDIHALDAIDALMTSYSGDYDLGGQVRNVDLLGQSGFALSMEAGYLNQDGKLFRVMTLTIPLIVNDLWSQHE